MRKLFNDYLNDNIKLNKKELIGIIFLVVVISGMFGCIYEVIFYYFNSGMKTFYYRGANFIPWINIYAYGALLILLFNRKNKKKPLKIFLSSMLITGLLEFVSGYVMYHYFNGLRCWDYNTEIWNFGNIGGYVCLRSVGFFGLSSLILMYAILPYCVWLAKRLKPKNFLILSTVLFSIIIFDESYNLFITRFTKTPRARAIYEKKGFNYMEYRNETE